MLEQGDERAQGAPRQLDPLGEPKARRGGLGHPLWDLQGGVVGQEDGHRQARLARPRDDLEAAAVERMERIVDRHRGRHGIQRGCR
jgi:hypothetical protein